MTTDDLREAYLSFFESKGCVRKPSDVLVPNDPSVLFTPAGMNQFKAQFLGIGPIEFTRATTCQKCIRTGDIENVGRTARHMTFFEMLGNFSFGDYFKREAIHWGWEFCTKTLGLAPERLSVTVYQDDDEASDLWHREIGLPLDRITRMDEADNFWPASAPSQGPDGVCGPCSEIFADIGTEKVEIWNLVFTQFNRVGEPPDNLTPLPKKNIDTGMGLERTAAVMQGVPTVFDIDIFKPVMAAISEITKVPYRHGGPETPRQRRLADHTRAATFLLHENVIPGPKKQGYVLQRLIRRAILDAWLMGIREPLMHRFVPAIVEGMKGPYPELIGTAASVADRLRREEEQFLRTIEKGLKRLDELLGRTSAGAKIPGDEAFDLYQTHGFPLEITEELAAGRGVLVDRAGFEKARERHSEVSGGGAFTAEVFGSGPMLEIKGKTKPTEFLGYDSASCEATVVGLIAGNAAVGSVSADSGSVTVVLDRTVFYGESGGQVGDVGTLSSAAASLAVDDTQKADGWFLHLGKVIKGSIKVGDKVTAAIDGERRAAIKRAHSATHMLHAALHQVIGDHATQAGSKVEGDLLRFDFAHHQAVSPTELAEIERLANLSIMKAAPIRADVMAIEEARKTGAMALFGEKYGDKVRVVRMGDFSTEFCGGCHLANTGEAGMLVITREESVSAGVRRIIALTGLGALAHRREQERLLAQSAQLVRARPEQLPERIEALQSKVRDLEKQVQKARSAGTADVADQLLAGAVEAGGGFFVASEVDTMTADELRALTDRLRAKRKPLAVLLACRSTKVVKDKATGAESTVPAALLVAAVADELTAKLPAGKWVGEAAKAVGGAGGGRPNLAQAGGTDPDKIPAAIQAALAFANASLG